MNFEYTQEEIKLMDDMIQVVENSSENSWCTDVVRKNGKNCFFGHLFEHYEKIGGKTC